MVSTNTEFTLVVCKVSLGNIWCQIFLVRQHRPPMKISFQLIKIVAVSRCCLRCPLLWSYCSVRAWGVVGVPSPLEWVKILLLVCSWGRGHRVLFWWQNRQRSAKLHIVWKMPHFIWWVLWGPPSIPWKNGHMLGCVHLPQRGRTRPSGRSISCRMHGILPLHWDVSPSNPWAVLISSWCFAYLSIKKWQLCWGPWALCGSQLGVIEDASNDALHVLDIVLR
jgi:hypothetical protein